MAAILFGAATLQAQQLAFPGAEGFGRYATGGRTGSVYHVTNLNDDGPGSFRDAVSSPNRIVVFDVAGVIRINSRISVSPNLYIAGQTAPGEGVTIYGNGLSFSGADNTICRYLRVRMGINGQKRADAIGISHGKNMIFDHVSAAWGRDETFSISGKHPEDITIQNSIISQRHPVHHLRPCPCHQPHLPRESHRQTGRIRVQQSRGGEDKITPIAFFTEIPSRKDVSFQHLCGSAFLSVSCLKTPNFF